MTATSVPGSPRMTAIQIIFLALGCLVLLGWAFRVWTWWRR